MDINKTPEFRNSQSSRGRLITEEESSDYNKTNIKNLVGFG